MKTNKLFIISAFFFFFVHEIEAENNPNGNNHLLLSGANIQLCESSMHIDTICIHVSSEEILPLLFNGNSSPEKECIKMPSDSKLGGSPLVLVTIAIGGFILLYLWIRWFIFKTKKKQKEAEDRCCAILSALLFISVIIAAIIVFFSPKSTEYATAMFVGVISATIFHVAEKRLDKCSKNNILNP